MRNKNQTVRRERQVELMEDICLTGCWQAHCNRNYELAMGKVIARRVVELGSVICVVAGGPTGAIVASDWLPQKILNLSKKAALEKWLQLYGTGHECPRFALLEKTFV